ncbi:hypothetical protein A2U01_0037509 [Trifolium medium]|uniref:Uncharacterized protein n=1 Tax=Trifolium medium TaxID=97028 RepID=A0A392PXF9_9FABA|nr:hypothetical protein [Trifolium medium]
MILTQLLHQRCNSKRVEIFYCARHGGGPVEHHEPGQEAVEQHRQTALPYYYAEGRSL